MTVIAGDRFNATNRKPSVSIGQTYGENRGLDGARKDHCKAASRKIAPAQMQELLRALLKVERAVTLLVTDAGGQPHFIQQVEERSGVELFYVDHFFNVPFTVGDQ